MKEGWEYKKLGEVTLFINGDRGKNYPSGTDFVESGLPFVNAGHLVNGEIDFSSMNYISKEKYNVLGSGKFIKNDILFCLRGSLGKHAQIVDDFKGAIASSLVIIRPGDEIESSFISHFLDSHKIIDYIKRDNNGSSQPNLSAKSVGSFLIPLPPKAIQLSIVSELDKINELIHIKKEQLKDYDNLAQSIFYEMFGDPVENEEDSVFKKLEEIYKFIDYRGKTPNKIESGVPLVTARNVRFGYLDYSIKDYISREEYLERQSRGISKKGDLLFSTEAPLGYAAIADLEEFSAGQRLITLQKKIEVENIYVMYYILSPTFQYLLSRQATGSTAQGIKASKLKAMKIPLPPLPLQQAFASRIEKIEQQKSEVQKTISDLETLLASRMQYWFE